MFLALVIFSGTVCLAQNNQADSLLAKTEDAIQQFFIQSHDTSYIANFSNELSLKILGVSKYTSFLIRDNDKKASITFRPYRQLNLGFGVAYKWFAIDLAFNVGIREDDETESRFLDFQGRVFSRKQYFEATYQYYYGYQISNIKGIDFGHPPVSTDREDVRTVKISLHYLYSFNYGKFSLLAPFILNEIQKKSAGSFIGGAFFSQYTMDADSSLVPPELDPVLSDDLNLVNMNLSTVGLNFGYMHSFIWRKLFLTLSLIPSLNLSFGDYKTTERSIVEQPLSFGYRMMHAVGYNSRKFFTGFQVSLNTISVKLEPDTRTGIKHGNAKFFVGYRFGSNKK